MGRFLRRLRGIFGTGLTWAVGWAGVEVVMSVVGGAPLQFLGKSILSGFARGFIAGGTFAVILSIAERRHTLEDLSLKRVAVWGGIGGGSLFLAVLPFLLPAGIPLGAILVPFAANSLVGAGFASGSVALALKADTKLLEGDDGSSFRLEGEEKSLRERAD